jgi:hypothetical protein
LQTTTSPFSLLLSFSLLFLVAVLGCKLTVNKEILAVVLSVLVQVPLAVFLGHYYDQRLFMDSGYLVSAGLNPYQSHLITVFSPYIIGVNPITGDPPLWPLLLGLVYRITYNIIPNIFLYNFATKLPVIAGNIGLAFLTKKILQQQGASEKKTRFAWLFLLFNPFVLLTSSAWGQFDTLISLLCIASLYLLSKGMAAKSAVLLSLSVVLKPVSFPLIGLPLLFSPERNRSKVIKYILVSVTIIAAFWFLPFYLFGWVIPASNNQATSFFTRAGGISLFTIVELLTNQVTLPTFLQLLGFLWVPALLTGYYLVYRDQPKTFNELTQKAAGIMLIFFLTFSWVSEPYINLVIALVLIFLPLNRMNFQNFHFLWVIPLIFMVITTNFCQLFFLVSPSIIPSLAQLDQNIRIWRLTIRFIVVIIWQVLAWRLVIEIFKRKRNSTNKPLP